MLGVAQHATVHHGYRSGHSRTIDHALDVGFRSCDHNHGSRLLQGSLECLSRTLALEYAFAKRTRLEYPNIGQRVTPLDGTLDDRDLVLTDITNIARVATDILGHQHLWIVQSALPTAGLGQCQAHLTPERSDTDGDHMCIVKCPRSREHRIDPAKYILIQRGQPHSTCPYTHARCQRYSRADGDHLLVGTVDVLRQQHQLRRHDTLDKRIGQVTEQQLTNARLAQQVSCPRASIERKATPHALHIIDKFT